MLSLDHTKETEIKSIVVTQTICAPSQMTHKAMLPMCIWKCLVQISAGTSTFTMLSVSSDFIALNGGLINNRGKIQTKHLLNTNWKCSSLKQVLSVVGSAKAVEQCVNVPSHCPPKDGTKLIYKMLWFLY
jgi:hypothetical protein